VPELDQNVAQRLDWRSRALERSLESARSRATDQFDRLLRAASELLRESGSDFTVHDVVERSQISLRAFYQYFEGKDDLILTMYEQSVRWILDLQKAAIADVTDPVERVITFCGVMCHHLEASPGPVSRALAIFYHRLSEIRPDHLALVHAHEFDYLVTLIVDCRRAGRVAIEATDAEIANLIMQSVFAFLQSRVLAIQYGGVVVSIDSCLSFVSACLR